MGGGAWWAAVHGVATSRTRLSNFTFTLHCPALEKDMATHSSVLAWRIPGTEEPGGLLSMGSQRVRHDWSNLAAAAAAVVCNPGWWIYRCWPQGNFTCFCAIYSSGGCARGCFTCPFLAKQNHSFKTIQVSEWLHIRKPELVILHCYMHGRSACHDWMEFWFSLYWSKWSPLNVSLHTVIHREMLTRWKMSPELNVLQEVMKIINHIKVHALNSCLFMQLCEEMDAEHKCLLLHTEMRQLSKSRSLASSFELWELLQGFLLEKQSPLAAYFSDTEGVEKHPYLCDVFNLLSELSLTLQGRMSTVQVTRSSGCI